MSGIQQIDPLNTVSTPAPRIQDPIVKSGQTNKILIFIILILVVVLITAGVIIYILYSDKENNNDNNGNNPTPTPTSATVTPTQTGVNELPENWSYETNEACKIKVPVPPLDKDIKSSSGDTYFKWEKVNIVNGEYDYNQFLNLIKGSYNTNLLKVRYNISMSNIPGEIYPISSGAGLTGIGITIHCIDNPNNQYNTETFYEKVKTDFTALHDGNNSDYSYGELTEYGNTELFGITAKKVKVVLNEPDTYQGFRYLMENNGVLYEIEIETDNVTEPYVDGDLINSVGNYPDSVNEDLETIIELTEFID